MDNSPLDILNKCLLVKPGMGIRLSFRDHQERSRYRWRCYAIMQVEAKRNKKLPPNDPAWGRHPWEDVTVRLIDEADLWIGHLAPPNAVSTEVPYPGRGG